MKTIFILASSLLLTSCSPEYEKGFHSTESGYMDNFESELIKRHIPFVKEKDGRIYYNSSNEDAVEKIHSQLNKKFSSAAFVKYKKPEVREYLEQLLTSKNIEHREEIIDGEVWIKWYPKDEIQQNKIQMEVVNYMFNLQSKAK